MTTTMSLPRDNMAATAASPPHFRIDKRAARQDLALIVESIRELKHRRGESHQPHWTGADIRELEILKDNATHMCMMLAHSRGRVHLKTRIVNGVKQVWSLERQEKQLASFWERYGMKPAA
jgi:hypothetical protein